MTLHLEFGETHSRRTTDRHCTWLRNAFSFRRQIIDHFMFAEFVFLNTCWLAPEPPSNDVTRGGGPGKLVRSLASRLTPLHTVPSRGASNWGAYLWFALPLTGQPDVLHVQVGSKRPLSLTTWRKSARTQNKCNWRAPNNPRSQKLNRWRQSDSAADVSHPFLPRWLNKNCHSEREGKVGEKVRN